LAFFICISILLGFLILNIYSIYIECNLEFLFIDPNYWSHQPTLPSIYDFMRYTSPNGGNNIPPLSPYEQGNGFIYINGHYIIEDPTGLASRGFKPDLSKGIF